MTSVSFVSFVLVFSDSVFSVQCAVFGVRCWMLRFYCSSDLSKQSLAANRSSLWQVLWVSNTTLVASQTIGFQIGLKLNHCSPGIDDPGADSFLRFGIDKVDDSHRVFRSPSHGHF